MGIIMLERIFAVTSLRRLFQTTVPKAVRDVLNVSVDDTIVWILDKREIKIRKA